MYNLPVINETHSDSILCLGEQFNAFATGALTYTWQPDYLDGDWNLFTPLETTTFVVTGTDENGCENSANFVVRVDECTSLKENIKIGQHTFLLYPNPTKGILKLVPQTQTAGVVILRISDATGKLIRGENVSFSHQYTTHILDLGNNPAGIYFLQIVDGERASEPVRIIKE